jgi:Ca2+-binding RTX toxin-like protein
MLNAIECLESRRLLSASATLGPYGWLRVVGETDVPNQITVGYAPDGTTVQVDLNGDVQSFTGVQRVLLLGGLADDQLAIDQTNAPFDLPAVIKGFWGDDTITGGDENDFLYGGVGADVIDAGNGRNFVDGGFGDDQITGGDGRDFVWGGPGHDLINTGGAGDVVHAGLGNDTVNGGDGNDWIAGNEGNDQLNGEAGDDKIWGGSGRDLITGGIGNDWLLGGLGNDTIQGGDGDDHVFGGLGDDTLDGGAGTNVVADFYPDGWFDKD